MNTRNKILLAAVALPIIVLAGKNWPFIANTFYPGLTFETDKALEFHAARNIPRKYMNTSVQNIKAGDTVRIIYGDAIYDFEVSLRCPAVAPCPLENPVRVDNPDSPSKPSRVNIAQKRAELYESREQTCRGAAAFQTTFQVSIPTGYWVSTSVVYNDSTFGTTATYVPGPPQVLIISLPSRTSACR